MESFTEPNPILKPPKRNEWKPSLGSSRANQYLRVVNTLTISDFYNYFDAPPEEREWLEELRLQIVQALLYQIKCVRKHGHCPELSDRIIRKGLAVLHL